MACAAIDSTGACGVRDRGNRRVQVFDQEGRFSTQLTQFGTPESVAFGRGDMMYIASPAPDNRVTIGTADSRVLETMEGLMRPTESRSLATEHSTSHKGPGNRCSSTSTASRGRRL